VDVIRLSVCRGQGRLLYRTPSVESRIIIIIIIITTAKEHTGRQPFGALAGQLGSQKGAGLKCRCRPPMGRDLCYENEGDIYSMPRDVGGEKCTAMTMIVAPIENVSVTSARTKRGASDRTTVFQGSEEISRRQFPNPRIPLFLGSPSFAHANDALQLYFDYGRQPYELRFLVNLS
jgi:hypothetical protein